MTDALFRRLRPSQVRELITLLIIVGLVIFFGSQIDGYLSGRTFNRITTDFPIIAVVAVGQLLVVLTRNIDLSVGSQVALVAWSSGRIATEAPDLNPLLLVAAGHGHGRDHGRHQWLHRGLRSRAGHHHHAGHAGDLSLVPHHRRRGADRHDAWATRLDGQLPWHHARERGGLRPAARLRRHAAGRRRRPVGPHLPALRPAPVRHRLQPGCRAHGGPADAARRLPRLRGLRCAGRPGRPHVHGQVRHHHRRLGPWAGAGRRRRGRRRRRQHLRWLRLDDRRAPRRGAHLHPRAEPEPLDRHQRLHA